MSATATGRALQVLGVLVVVACGAPFFSELVLEIPAQTIRTCEIRYTPRFHFDVTLPDGLFLDLDQYIEAGAPCFAVGTTLEKRRGQFGYEIGGRRYLRLRRITFPNVFLVIVGLAICSGGTLLRLVHRRRVRGCPSTNDTDPE